MKGIFNRMLSISGSYFLGKAIGGHRETSALVNISTEAIRRVLLLSTMMVVGVFVMLGGYFVVLADLLLATRTQGSLALTQVSIVGGTLVLLSTLSLFFVFKDSAWKVEMEKPKPAPSPLMEAVTDLVRDFIDERRLRREYGETEYPALQENVAEIRGQQRSGTPLHM